MATATKQEPKAGKKDSKSAQIREYARAHRKATANEIAEKFGCSAALVHQVRRKMKGKKKAKSTATISTIANSNTAIAAEGSPTELCVTFVRAVGSFAEARKILLTAEAFAGLKIR
jgi:hypothetical protein